jgi:hypothetical protein
MVESGSKIDRKYINALSLYFNKNFRGIAVQNGAPITKKVPRIIMN